MELLNVHQLSEVRSIIGATFKAKAGMEYVSLMEGIGRVLGQGINSNENIPGFNRSTVDGYAVKANNTYGSSESMPTFFDLVGEIKMGEYSEKELFEGEAIYVPTGGMVPKGADAVVMIEHVELIEDLLNVFEQVSPRQNVVFEDEDIKIGELVLKKGHRLRPQDLGGLAAIGITDIPVLKKVKVGIMSTGDEIVSPETKKLKPGQIRDINGISISAAVKAIGGEVTYKGIVKDNFKEYFKVAQALLEEVDFLILSGGSSMGTKDFTSQIMNELGKPGVLVHGISIKPGKPTIIANCNGKPVMGLPGHPVSAMVLFEIFGKQIINQLQGVEDNNYIKQLKAKTNRNIPSQVGRTDYIRVNLELKEEELWVVPIFGKSGLITNLVRADGMIEIPQNKEGIVAGQTVNVTLL